MSSNKHNNPRAWAAGALILASVLAGCTNGDDNNDPPPEPTGTETTEDPTDDPTTEEPTDDPTLSEQDQQIADAREFLDEAHRVESEVANQGYEGWQETLFPYYANAPDHWADLEVAYGYLEDEGEYTEGATQVVSAEATEYREDTSGAGQSVIEFRLCIDPSEVTVYDAQGSEVEDGTRAGAHQVDASVIAQPDSDLGWSYTDVTPEPEESC